MSKANGIKTCRLSQDAFSCLAILFDAAFRDASPTVKVSTLNPTSGETPCKSCFPPTHPYSITYASLSIDLLSSGSVRKFTCTSFFTSTSARLNISKKSFLKKSYMYLKPKTCYSKVYK